MKTSHQLAGWQTELPHSPSSVFLSMLTTNWLSSVLTLPNHLSCSVRAAAWINFCWPEALSMEYRSEEGKALTKEIIPGYYHRHLKIASRSGQKACSDLARFYRFCVGICRDAVGRQQKQCQLETRYRQYIVRPKRPALCIVFM